jgi:GxxExxY protein
MERTRDYPGRELTEKIIGAMIEVHRHIGPGLLESAYEVCTCHELHLRGVAFEAQKPLPVVYKNTRLECGYRADPLVDGRVLVEMKAADSLAPIHEAQLLTYMRLSGVKVGLLVNFNVTALKDGIRRLVL